MEQHVVSAQITINAPQAAVWDALTNPAKTKKYFFGCGVFSTWQPGSPIEFKARILWLFSFGIKGTVLEIDPGNRLKYELENKGKAHCNSTINDTLSYSDSITTLSITDDVGTGEGAEKRYKPIGKRMG